MPTRHPMSRRVCWCSRPTLRCATTSRACCSRSIRISRSRPPFPEDVCNSMLTCANAKPLELAVMHDCYLPAVKAASTLRHMRMRRRVRRMPRAWTSSSVERLRAPIFVMTQWANLPRRNRRWARPNRRNFLNEWIRLPPLQAQAIRRFRSLRLGARPAVRSAYSPSTIAITCCSRHDLVLSRADRRSDEATHCPAPYFHCRDRLRCERACEWHVCVTQPDASVRTIAADKWGRVRIRPLQAGRYTVESGGSDHAGWPTITTRPSRISPRNRRPKLARPVGRAAALANYTSLKCSRWFLF